MVSHFIKNQPIFTGLEDVCSGKDANHIYLVARIFQLPEPTQGLVSLLLEAKITSSGLKCQTLLNAREIITNYSSQFNCLGVNSGGVVYVGEDDSYIEYKDGHAKIINLVGIKPRLGGNYSIYVADAKSFFLGTGNGKIAFVRDEGITQFALIPDDRYFCVASIHGIGVNFVVAVGDNGAVARLSNGKWKNIPSPTNEDLAALYCRSETEIYIGGRFGLMWRWDGDGSWQPLTVKDNKTYFNVCGFAYYQGVIYGAFGEAGICRLDGDNFTSVPEVKGIAVGKIRTTDSGLIALGAGLDEESNWFIHFDGRKWSAEKVTISI